MQEHMELARRLVGRLVRRVPANIDQDALESDAMLGLLQAARAFDPTRGASFKTYATRRIVGAMVDGLRTRGGRKSVFRQLRRMVSLSTVVCHNEGDPLTLENVLAGKDEPVGARIERQEEVQWLMRQLKPSTGLMVRQYYFEELTQQEIGQLQGITSGLISLRLKAARVRMKEAARLG